MHREVTAVRQSTGAYELRRSPIVTVLRRPIVRPAASPTLREVVEDSMATYSVPFVGQCRQQTGAILHSIPAAHCQGSLEATVA